MRGIMYNGVSDLRSLDATMDEQELPLIQITEDDIAEANRLSLHCPMCASAVENFVEDDALTPVMCANCKTLYHRACWEQSGNKCAILGCDHDKYIVYGTPTKPVLTIRAADIPKAYANGRKSGRTKALKAQQRRQVEQLRRPSLLQRLWQWLLDQIRIG